MAASDRDTDATVAAGLAKFRELISPSVHRIIGRYATQINLRHGSKRRQLENDVIDALLWGTVADLEESTRKRGSHVRKDLMRVGKEARAAERHLESLRSALSELPPVYGELLNANLESVAKIALSLVAKQAPWFHTLSSVADIARTIARGIRDKGGKPKMLAFRMLVLCLKPAFERATGRRAGVTWNPVKERYEGDFVKLIEAVVPLALSLESTSRPMRIPNSEYARGRYIDRMTGAKGP